MSNLEYYITNLTTFEFPFIRELPFQKGDIVYIYRQVDQNWFEGEHHGRVGIFPHSYVEVDFLYPLILNFLFIEFLSVQ